MAVTKMWKKTIAGFEGELFVTEAYCKVANVSGSKEGVDYQVAVFADKEETPVDFFNGSFIPQLNSNFIAQAYEHLKTLPEFSDAVDC